MARPYFTGNYGSALAKVDTRPIIEAGRATGQMYAQMGQDIGGVIKEYGLNKQKRAELTNKIESTIKLNPDYMTRMTSTGIEADDKKAQTLQDKLTSGNANMTELKGLAGELAMMEAQDLKAIAEETRAFAREGAEQNRRLVDLNIKGKEQSNKDAEALANIRTRDQGFLDAAYKRYDSRIHQLLAESTKPNFDVANLLVEDQKILANYDLIQNRQVKLDKLFTMPGEEVDLAAARQGLKNAKLQEKKGKQDLKRTERLMKDEETARKPGEYADLDAVNTEIGYQLEQGFIATAEVKPDGTWTISKSVPIEEAINDLIPLDETKHPNVYRFKDSSELFYMPPGEKPSKIGVGDPGADARLQQAFLNYLNDADAKWYATAMRDGTLDDGVYEWTDANDIDREVKYNAGMETKVRKIRELEGQLQKQIFDIRP